MAPQRLTPSEAAALVRSRDSLGIPLGPGQPSAFLHALGDRDDWMELTVFGALLIDLFAIFTHPGVRYLSGFYGPAERFLVDSGARVEFIPADFRRFTRIAEQLAPRVVATAAAAPDRDGFLSHPRIDQPFHAIAAKAGCGRRTGSGAASRGSGGARSGGGSQARLCDGASRRTGEGAS